MTDDFCAIFARYFVPFFAIIYAAGMGTFALLAMAFDCSLFWSCMTSIAVMGATGVACSKIAEWRATQ
jgi:hypothetical protein